MSAQTVPPSVDRGRVAWLLAGGAALVGGTLLGWNGTLLEAIATPPAVVRAALVGTSVVVAGWLIVRAVRRMEEARGVASGELTSRDLAGLIRGVRYVFLAVAALSAAARLAARPPAAVHRRAHHRRGRHPRDDVPADRRDPPPRRLRLANPPPATPSSPANALVAGECPRHGHSPPISCQTPTTRAFSPRTALDGCPVPTQRAFAPMPAVIPGIAPAWWAYGTRTPPVERGPTVSEAVAVRRRAPARWANDSDRARTACEGPNGPWSPFTASR